MNILTTLSIRNLKLNKKRTISTIIGIILSVALICAVASMGMSFQATLVENAKNQSGYWHLKLENVSDEEIKDIQNNRDVKDTFAIKICGYSILQGSQNDYKPYARLISMNESSFKDLHFELIEGRFPVNNNEVVISKTIMANGKVEYKIGETINLNVGTRSIKPGVNEKEYDNIYDAEEIINATNYSFKIVGIIERPDTSFEKYSEPGYTVITTGISTGRSDLYISLKSPKNYKETIPQILRIQSYESLSKNDTETKYDYTLNKELLRWEAFAFSDSTVTMLYSVIGVVIVIILFTSIFCIRNSFAISITEKIKMYSMLASVGATKRQIRKNVIQEGLILGLIGIPLGILSGFFAVFVLIQIVNSLLGDYLLQHVDGLVFKISILPIILSAVLGFVTIYLSSITSAIKASRVSPIEGLRGSKDIKLNSKKLKVPKIISKLFKTGGELAYKNLKRSKKKYRTTIISIAVSIFVFITMNSFIVNMFQESQNYYKDYDYNIQLNVGKVSNEEIDRIISLDNIEKYSILYSLNNGDIKIKDIDKINLASGTLSEEGYYDEENEEFIETGEKYSALQIMALDSDSFKRYVNKIGAKYDKVKDKGILCDEVSWIEDGQVKNGRKYKYNVGDIIEGKDYNDKQRSVEVGAISTIKPDGIDRSYYEGGYLILDISQLENEEKPVYNTVTIQSNNPDQLEKDIDALHLDINVYNISASVKEENAMVLVIKIFLYGFITVITLIGITNIFNTITSNMELRQKEFAMLKSIGMTSKEFDRMINLETIFYGTKAWIIGTIMGLLGTFAIYKAFSVKFQKGMYIPTNAILISAVFVFIFIFIIMRYSIYKINKQNTIETIRNENV